MTMVKLLSKELVADGTMLFKFAKPDDFAYRAGQSVDMTLTGVGMHPFSLVSAPHEEWIGNATRIRDSVYKQTLKNMVVGTEVEIEGPFGSFFLHQDSARPAVFLVGGIGVTPFYSMAKDAAERKLPHQIRMFYSNRRPEDAAFLTELQELTYDNPNFKLIPTMTDIATSDTKWPGEQGHIDEALIKKFGPTVGVPIYYLAGPQAMVTAMRTLLTKMGVSEDDIRFEEFTGY